MKLQDSYSVEANALGTWQQIGYTAPNAKATGSSSETSNFTYSYTSASDWVATAKQALNDCQKNSTWTVGADRNSNTGIVSYTAAVKNQGSSDADCTALTPNFEKGFSTKAAN